MSFALGKASCLRVTAATLFDGDIPADLGPMVAVAAGSNHTCGVIANGDLVCFGDNRFGQCDVPVDLGALWFAPPNQKTCFKPCPVELAVVHRVDH